MKRIFTFIMVAVVTLILQGCFGSGGSSAPPPNNVVVAAKDSRVVVTWDMVPGVEYWIFRAVGSGITPTTCSSMSLCSTTIKVTSPLTVSGLSNGTTYSFTINGRTGGGPGGAGSPAIQATPRLAGGTWSTGAATIPASNLLGVAYGGSFVAAGMSGALFSSSDGITWSALTNPLATPLATTFNAVNYDSARGEYLSVGTGGKIIAMTPSSSSTWTAQTGYVGGQDLFAIASSGSYLTTVATGASGTIIYSADGGVTWADKTSAVTANPLYGVTFGYDYSNARYVFVAVGASRTLLYSLDYGLTWLAGTCGVTCTAGTQLKGVTYGATGTASGVFIAVGASGTVLTSPDGITWTQQTSLPTATLNAVTYSSYRRFIAVAADGSIYYNEYANGGVTWTQAIPATGTALNSVTAGGLYDYSAVGTLNRYSD